MWTYPAKAWQLVAPFSVAMMGMPIIGPATQSIFTRAIISRPELEPIQARLQSLFSMAGEVANFLTPLFVGAYVLRPPELVESGTNNNELTPYCLYIPIFSGLCIIGFFYEKLVLHVDDDEDDGGGGDDEFESETGVVSETSILLNDTDKIKKRKQRSSLVSIQLNLSAKNEANVRRASAIMGGNHSIPVFVPFDTLHEKKRREESLKISKELVDMIQTYSDDNNPNKAAEN